MQISSEAPAPQADLGEPDIDASLEQEVNTGPTGLDGANDSRMENDVDAIAVAPALEARISAKKDISLREFLPKMDEYAPIVRLAASINRSSCPPPSRKRSP